MKLVMWKAPKITESNFYIKGTQTWAFPHWITLGLWDAHIRPVIFQFKVSALAILREEKKKLLLLFAVLSDLASSWKFYLLFKMLQRMHMFCPERHNPNVVLNRSSNSPPFPKTYGKPLFVTIPNDRKEMLALILFFW